MPKVTMSTPVAMNADALWQAIGSFAAIGDWHPMVEKVDSQGEQKGSVRTLQLIGGAKLVERLEEVSPTERLYRYSIVESPLPVSNYVAEIRVKDKGDGSSLVEWSSDFTVNTRNENDVVKTFQEVYQAGLDNLTKLYGFKRG
jgi:mxaD protein